MLDILTHQNVGNAVAPVGHMMAGGWANNTLRPLASPELHFAGQIVAVVVAKTLEQAQAAALAIRTGYEASSHTGTLAEANHTSEPLADLRPGFKDRRTGNFADAIAEAAVSVDAIYTTPIQHHNPIELPTTTCIWQEDMLTVYEPASSAQHALALLHN